MLTPSERPMIQDVSTPATLPQHHVQPCSPIGSGRGSDAHDADQASDSDGSTCMSMGISPPAPRPKVSRAWF